MGPNSPRGAVVLENIWEPCLRSVGGAQKDPLPLALWSLSLCRAELASEPERPQQVEGSIASEPVKPREDFSISLAFPVCSLWLQGIVVWVEDAFIFFSSSFLPPQREELEMHRLDVDRWQIISQVL